VTPFAAPPGLISRRLAAGTGWFRPSVEKPIRSFWQKTNPGLRFSEVVRRSSESQRHPGRTWVYSAPIPGAGTLVVRPCVHGGVWGRIAGDLYLGPDRVRREVLAAQRLARMKIPTPPVEAVLFYPAGPFTRIEVVVLAAQRLARMKIPTPPVEAVLFYPAGPFTRIEVVTRLIPASRDLVAFLSSRPGPAERQRLFSSIRKLFAQLHRQGVGHPDLNARNILLSTSDPSPVWLLDVDGVCFESPSHPSVDTANRNRLLRSLLKRARLGDLGWSEPEVAKLWKELFPHR